MKNLTDLTLKSQKSQKVLDLRQFFAEEKKEKSARGGTVHCTAEKSAPRAVSTVSAAAGSGRGTADCTPAPKVISRDEMPASLTPAAENETPKETLAPAPIFEKRTIQPFLGEIENAPLPDPDFETRRIKRVRASLRWHTWRSRLKKEFEDHARLIGDDFAHFFHQVDEEVAFALGKVRLSHRKWFDTFLKGVEWVGDALIMLVTLPFWVAVWLVKMAGKLVALLAESVLVILFSIWWVISGVGKMFYWLSQMEIAKSEAVIPEATIESEKIEIEEEKVETAKPERAKSKFSLAWPDLGFLKFTFSKKSPQTPAKKSATKTPKFDFEWPRLHFPTWLHFTFSSKKTSPTPAVKPAPQPASRAGFALSLPKLAAEMVALLVLILVVSGVVSGVRLLKNTQNAAGATVADLQSFAADPDLQNVEEVIARADFGIVQVEGYLEQIGLLPNYFENYSFFQAGSDLLTFSKKMSAAAEKGAELIGILRGLSLGNILQEGEAKPDLHAIIPIFDELLIDLGEADAAIAKVDPTLLPGKYADKVREIRERQPLLLVGLEESRDWLETVLRLLGAERPMRYLFVLQNSGEIRPTGGFVGSLALVDIDNGQVSFEMADVYDYDGQLHSGLPAPFGIAELSDEFKLRDANYWPDFPTSAASIASLFEKAGGPTVDGVVAVTDTILGDLLAVSGPVEMPEFDVEFRADDWYFPLVKIIENKEAGRTTPKRVLFELAEQIKNKISGQNSWRELLVTLLQALQQKQIQVQIFDDEEACVLLQKLGVAGEQIIPDEGADYLHISRTSIGGNKSDKLIDEQMAHQTRVAEDGTIEDTVTVTRTHTWDRELEDELRRRFNIFRNDVQRDYLIDILGRGDNRTYFRVYVPRGSELVQVEGLDPEQVTVTDDGTWTQISFITEIAPAETETWSLRYKLPFQMTNRAGQVLDFALQKQAGTLPIAFFKSVDTAANWCVENGEECVMQLEEERVLEGDYFEKLLIRGR